MKDKLPAKLRAVTLFLCCAVLTLLGGGARAEEDVETGARAAVLIERNTGMVLLCHNENEPLPMASTTKVMTALLALEKGNLDDVVTVGRNAYGVPGTSIYLNLGEHITLRNLLYGLLLASGNDAAVAIAEHIGGSVEAFCTMMTERAAELGCENTVFVNPNGLPAEGHHTTAYDLALIAREAMKHETFREIVSTRRASIPWEGRSYDRILNNKNRLLTDYEGATGIKTGFTSKAGRCLVFSAEREGMELIGVVLNCGTWFDSAERLLDWGFANYSLAEAAHAGEAAARAAVRGGEEKSVELRAEADVAAAVCEGDAWRVVLEADELRAPVQAGQVCGRIALEVNGEILAQANLLAAQDVARWDFWAALRRIFRRF